MMSTIVEAPCPTWCTTHAFVDSHQAEAPLVDESVCVYIDADFGDEPIVTVAYDPTGDPDLSIRLSIRDAKSLLAMLETPEALNATRASLRYVLDQVRGTQ